MTLEDALQETGCAIFVEGQCTTSVERLPNDTLLLMTRRGVSILQHAHVNWPYLEIHSKYKEAVWRPAEVVFVPKGQICVVVPKNAKVTADWIE